MTLRPVTPEVAGSSPVGPARQINNLDRFLEDAPNGHSHAHSHELPVDARPCEYRCQARATPPIVRLSTSRSKLKSWCLDVGIADHVHYEHQCTRITRLFADV